MTEVTITLAMPAETCAELRRLQTVTAAPDLGRLVQDATRVYAWLLAHQDAGRHVVILEPDDVTFLAQNEALHGKRESLAPLRKRYGWGRGE